MRVVAIDQGTTSTRAIAFSDDEHPRVIASVRHRQIYPAEGWVEHDPLELLASVEHCIAAAGAADVIGLANQGESCLAWDSKTLKPLSPVIVWQDQRTAGAIELLKAAELADEVTERSGLPLDCYFSASKLAWIIGNCTDARAALRRGTLRLGTTDTFLLERLGGVHATDATTASRTSLMNIGACAWDPVLCKLFDIPIETLPSIRPTCGDFGEHRGIPIRASIVDQQAALYGHGCRNFGDAKITFGTGAFVLALAGSVPPGSHGSGMITTVAWQTPVETRYAIEGSVYDAGAAIEWCQRIGLVTSVDELCDFGTPTAIQRGLVFVPALSGLAYPHWTRDAGGMWAGMSTATSRRDLQQAVLEGIALQTEEVLSGMANAVPGDATLSVDGGLTSNQYFLQFLADVTNRRVGRHFDTELTAYGCALLAGHKPAASRPARAASTIEPAIGATERHSRIDRYRAAARAAVALGTGR